MSKKKNDEELQENQTIVLAHLKNVSNKQLFIPIISLNKTFSYTKLVEEVTNLSDNGKAFIKEFMELLQN